MPGQWGNPIFLQTISIVVFALFASGIPVYLLRNRSFYFTVAWASLKSWLVAGPLALFLLGAPRPWPLVMLALIAIYGVKTFFQFMGIFHKSAFVIIAYLGIVALAVAAAYNKVAVYNIVPMVVLGIICLIPIASNAYKNMLQYISLTIIGLMFLGWSFLHLALILHLNNGIYQLMYLIILTEFCDNTNLATAHYFPKSRRFDKVLVRRTWGSTILAAFLTILLAYGMRHLLPARSEVFWLTAGLISSFAGSLGDMVLSVFKRDMGIKVAGPFILGRGDFLSRMHRLILVAPIYYYAMTYLLGAK